jgi:branched-chain amino acid transport system ATP-binding protein
VLLELSDFTVAYGEIIAVHDLSLTIDEGEIVTLVGSNGAGKTSTLSAIVGLVRPRAGVVRFAGDRIDRMPAERVARSGIALVPEGRRVFPGLTVRENLEVASTAGRATRSTMHGLLRQVYELFPQLEDRHKQRAWSLSGGEQQMLAIGRAIMAQPRLMLLDEPSLGLAPLVARDVLRRVTTFTRNAGLSVLLVEQNAALGFSVAERAYVLETGSLVLEGSTEEVLSDPRVRTAYLGEAPSEGDRVGPTSA